MYKHLIYEYETVLLDNKKSFASYFFSYTPEQNEKMALHIIKYAIEKHLRWSPEQALRYFSWDTIKLMKLDSIIRFVNFPPETDPKQDLFVVISKLYPYVVSFNSNEMTILVYQRVLDGDSCKFPKDFFSGNKGVCRALLCMQYMLSQFTRFESLEAMYQTFASPEGTKLLKQYRLIAASSAIYKYPLDFLYEALPANMKNEYLYRFYRFKLTNNEQIRRMKKKGTFIV